MLSSHSWWKWSEPTITSTSGPARVSVSRNALDLAHPLVGERRRGPRRSRCWPVVERVVGRGDDGDDFGHRDSFVSGPRVSVGVTGRGPVDVRRVAVDGQVDVHADRVARAPRRAGRAGRRRGPAARTPRSSSTGRPRSASAAPQTPAPLSGSVPAEHLRVHPADRLEQPQVRARRPSSSAIRHAAPGSAGRAPCAPGGRGRARTAWPRGSAGRRRARARPSRRRRPAAVARRASASTAARNAPQSSVTPRNREPPPSSPAASAPCSESGRGQVGQPGGDRGRA